MTPLLLVFMCKFSVGDCLLDGRVVLNGGVSDALAPGGVVVSVFRHQPGARFDFKWGNRGCPGRS
jgi:hypothetical protein